jgi:predicted lipoprotein with Yx(FWY)xxD motif
MLTFRRTKPTVSLGKTPIGEVLVDADGRTVYLFTADNGEQSGCYGECATAWFRPRARRITSKP